jgi:hypothetical protein
LDNVQLACATHNGYLAEREYGKEVIERHKKNRRSASRVSEPTAVYTIGNRVDRPAEWTSPRTRRSVRPC